MLSANNSAEDIVGALLGDKPLAQLPISEASVHRSTRSRIYVASFTGPEGGQLWRSTGLTDRDQALLVAKNWEAEARAQRAKLGCTPRKPIVRVRRSEPSTGRPSLSQREVALLLGMSERGVREVERRAIQKLRSHPLLRQVWHQFLAGELDEARPVLTPPEIEALFNLVRTPEEHLVLQKVLQRIRMRP